MQLVPTQEEVIALLRQTGALKSGHFIHPNGLHASEYLELPMAMRNYQHAKTLSVGLSRLLRAHADIRAAIPELSIVAPAPNGLPVAYGICEALRANQVYWASRNEETQRMQFPQQLQPHPGEKIVLVDDILRTGKKLTEIVQIIEAAGAQVMGLAVIVYQPVPDAPDFSPIPLYYLAKLDAMYYPDEESAERANLSAKPEAVWL